MPIWAKIPEDKKPTKPLENNSTSDKTPKNKVTEEEKTRVFDLWTQIFGMNGFKYASKQLIDLINMYLTELISEQIQQYTAFAGDNFSVTMVIDLLKNSLHHAYTKELEERKSESIVEEQTELSEVEKLKQKIAELEAKVNSKPKEVRGLFDDADLKKSEKKITDNLDKMTGKNPQDFEQTDLF